MFKIPRPNVIQRSDGVTVEVIGRTKLVYTEFDRKVNVGCEWLAGPSALIVYTDTIKQWNVPAGVGISNDEKVKIIENIRKAFRFRNLEIEVL